MAGLSTYAANKVLDHILKGTAFTQPTNLYIGLSTADPTADGSGIAEPSGGSYARDLINTAFGAASARAVTTDELIEFATATGSWGTITHWFISDALTGGNMLWYGTLTTSKTISSGDTLSFPIGDLDLSFT